VKDAARTGTRSNRVWDIGWKGGWHAPKTDAGPCASLGWGLQGAFATAGPPGEEADRGTRVGSPVDTVKMEL
jgi:hypothetical protein